LAVTILQGFLIPSFSLSGAMLLITWLNPTQQALIRRELATRFMFWPQIPTLISGPLMARSSPAIRITTGAFRETGSSLLATAPKPPKTTRGSQLPGRGSASYMGARVFTMSSLLYMVNSMLSPLHMASFISWMRALLVTTMNFQG